MKRSMIITALTLASLVATGCGTSPTSGVPFKSTVRNAAMQKAPAQAANVAVGVSTGNVVLQMSSLREAAKAYSTLATKADVVALEVKLTGPGLSAPLVRRMTAAELTTSNTVAFEGVPVGAFQITLTAFDKSNKGIGTKSTNVQVAADEETKVALQLKLDPTVKTGNVSFSFDLVDGDEVEAPAPTPAPETDEDEDEAEETAPAPTPSPTGDGLAIEVTGKEVVRKLLLLKKLSVTVKVTNESAETLSGAVKIEFYSTSGLFNKETKLVETQTQDVKNLAPGKSVELTLLSTKSASDAEATVHTVLSSSSASTADVE
jgi:hypothetical protein